MDIYWFFLDFLEELREFCVSLENMCFEGTKVIGDSLGNDFLEVG